MKQNLIKNSCPATLNNSNQVSFEQYRFPVRKYSVASITSTQGAQSAIDIDKVIVDIKLKPLKSNEIKDKIKSIYECLTWLKKTAPGVLEQVRTAELVIQSIESKLMKQIYVDSKVSEKQNLNGNYSRQFDKQNFVNHAFSQKKRGSFSGYEYSESKNKHSNFKNSNQVQQRQRNHSNLNNYSNKKQNNQDSKINSINRVGSFSSSSRKQNDQTTSPIKQLDQRTSRIVYTNVSLRQFQQKQSCSRQKPHIKSSSRKQKSDSEDYQIQKINKDIQRLNKVLKKKGILVEQKNTKNSFIENALKQRFFNNNTINNEANNRNNEFSNKLQKNSSKKGISFK